MGSVATMPRPARSTISAGLIALFGVVLGACGASAGGDSAGGASNSNPTRKQIVVTYSVLGAVVTDLVGDTAQVTVLMPNGIDPHEWEPSAKDIERVQHADLVIENGLGLEAGIQDTLSEARNRGVRVFTASDYIDVRTVGTGEGVDPADADQAPGADDPHLWMDPTNMISIAKALAVELSSVGVDVGDRTAAVSAELTTLDTQVTAIIARIPAGDRKLVTGHESLGYFARRYGFLLIGAVVPSVSSQAESSAGELAALRTKITNAGVAAIFAEIGTPADVVGAIAEETGARVVQLGTHNLPADGSYATFMTDLANTIADGLAG